MTRRRFVLGALTLLIAAGPAAAQTPAPASRTVAAAGKAFADFMVSPAVQAVIRAFGVDKYGQPLFVPIAGQREEEIGR